MTETCVLVEPLRWQDLPGLEATESPNSLGGSGAAAVDGDVVYPATAPGNAAIGWHSNDASQEPWLQLDLGAAFALRSAAIMTRNGVNWSYPAALQISASPTGAFAGEQVELGTAAVPPIPNENTWSQPFSWENDTAYRYWRFTVAGVAVRYGDNSSSDALSVSELAVSEHRPAPVTIHSWRGPAPWIAQPRRVGLHYPHTGGARRLRALHNYGRGSIRGTVTVEGEPAVRRVLLVDRRDMRLIRMKVSDASGAYRFDYINPDRLYLVLGLDHTAQHNAVVADRVEPVLMQGVLDD